MNTAEIRAKFLSFFAERGHTVVDSSSLVPANDPTLLFTNSGMVQFKDVFLGNERRNYVRAASCQACLRAGGKHNDLENVGYTARHHTFFEMLGNWSFGDYFKRDSIQWGWELLTQVYGLPADRLWATVYHEDDEAYEIWTQLIGLPSSRVVRIGDNKGAKYASDNFWMMADTGPCGPCSEIFYDHGEQVAGGPPGSADADGDRYIEIWNHVFMQFDMQADGSIKKLPAPCVDTGMGLERLAAILQGKHSNYEIDLFARLIDSARRETQAPDRSSPSLRVIADHIRASAFLMVDGVIPGNEGRGYVLRRIIRRAIRHGYKLGVRAPFFYRLIPDLVDEMGSAYPNLRQQAPKLGELLKLEEERFFLTIEHGMVILDSALAKKIKTLSGDTAFKLHDTYGFPLDLTQDVCREHGVIVDSEGFEQAMQQQKEQARSAGKFKMADALEYQGGSTVFHGYEKCQSSAKILALYREGAAVERLEAGEKGVVVLDHTPFYAESGGQVGDKGEISTEMAGCWAQFRVEDTQKIQSEVIAHHGYMQSGALTVGGTVLAKIDEGRRARTMRHHSATHLMHKALRQVLGDHVQQKGSLVDDEKTRFDFAHSQAMSAEQIAQVEQIVNREILMNTPTEARTMPMEQARQTGAMMLFGEKYGDLVRVLSIGHSVELCGGTHVARTGDIGFFKIVSEGGTAAGIRRVEAVCGEAALAFVQNQERLIHHATQALKTSPQQLVERLMQGAEEHKQLEKSFQQLKEKLAQLQGNAIADQVIRLGEYSLLAQVMDATDAKGLRHMLDNLREKLPQALIVLGSVHLDKVHLIAGVPADLTSKIKAGEWVNAVAQVVGGKGGGKPEMAMAGGTEVDKLPQAMAMAQSWLSAKLLG